MGRDIDSIPFYNDKEELIASFNAYMNILYWGNAATDEDKENVVAALAKKKHKNYQIWDSKPTISSKTSTQDVVPTQDVVDEPQDVVVDSESATKPEKKKSKKKK